ncbi:MAG: zinc ribbon domain-containing protein [Burkholderiales bacterium]|nr:zinc ribbon domain-containing protein [Burkholderiales bacterium]
MPIFEYQCTACGNRFEQLVRASTVPQCPRCASQRLDKQLSVFAAGGSSAAAAPALPMGPCGSCGHPDGPGSCALH